MSDSNNPESKPVDFDALFSPRTLRSRLKARLVPLMDLSAWVLLVLSAVPMLLLQPAAAITMMTWTASGIALMGVALMINMIVLPQLSLSRFLTLAEEGSTSAAIVVASVLGLLAVVFMGLVLWAKG